MGCYDFDDMLYYSVFGRVTQEVPQHVGVVVSISSETFYFGEYVYTVLCVDGNKRFFLREELARL